MPKRVLWHRVIAAILLFTSPKFRAQVEQKTPAAQAQAGGVAAGNSKFHVVRSVSGTQGAEQGGRYTIQDPRDAFYVPDDHHVIVYFEWDGPPGKHHFEGVWKNPSGKVSAVSEFDYEAKQTHFGAYWELLISDASPTGIWTVEARVDGEITGTYTFQILAGTRPATAIPTRRVLSPSELYQRATAAAVSIENTTPSEERSVGMGFFVGADLVLTAFQVIDGATSLRVSLPTGQVYEIHEIAAWNRMEDWALLRIPAAKAALSVWADSWSVGDHCIYLDSTGPGERVIADAAIVGKSSFSGAGERIILNTSPTFHAIGSALLNDYGEVIGVVGGTLVPGFLTPQDLNAGALVNIRAAGALYRAPLVTPIDLVRFPAAHATSTSLVDMMRNGQFLPPLKGREEVLYGTMALRVEGKKEQGMMRPVGERNEFSKRDSQASVYIQWMPKKKHKGTISCQLFDLNNKLLSQSDGKAPLQPGNLTYSSITVGLANLAVGVYRLDVLLDGDLTWRTFFRVTE